jgi:hypothetical protein
MLGIAPVRERRIHDDAVVPAVSGALLDTDQFIAVSGSGQVRIFKENGEQVRTLPAGSAFLQALAITPDGRVAAAGATGTGVTINRSFVGAI